MDTSSPTKKKRSELTSTTATDYVSGFDLISVEGYRQDGRKPDELRHFRVSFNVVPDADGSCYMEHGNCKLLATIYGPYEGESRSNQEQAVITCDFSMTSYCVSERRLRTFGDMKSQKLQMGIQRVFQQAVITETYPKSQIDIHLKILQSDGNDYCPCVNATTLAFINAGRTTPSNQTNSLPCFFRS
jgi:exosome complex component RRP41